MTNINYSSSHPFFDLLNHYQIDYDPAVFFPETPKQNRSLFERLTLNGPISSYFYVQGDISDMIASTGHTYCMMHGIESPKYLSGFELTAGLNILTGYAGITKAITLWNRSWKVDDLWGKIFGSASFIRGGLETLTGLVSFPIVFSNLFDLFQTSKIYHVASKVLKVTGTTLYPLIFSLIMLPTSYTIHRIKQFYLDLHKLKKKDKSPEENAKCLMQYLHDHFHLTGEEIQTFQEKIMQNKEKILQGKCKPYSYTQEDCNKLTEGDLLAVNLFQQKTELSHTKEEAQKLAKYLIGEMLKCREKKEYKLQRYLGLDGFELLKKELMRPFENRILTRLDRGIDLQKTLMEATHFKKKLLQSVNLNLLLNLAIAFFAILGGSAMVLSLVASGGIPGIVAMAFLAVTLVGFSAIDITYFLQTIRHKKSTRQDQILLYLSGIFLLSVASIVALLSSGPVGIGVSLTATVLWLAIMVYTHMSWKQDHMAQERGAPNTIEGVPLFDV